MTLTANDNSATQPGALYRTLWRWHFYAGLICIPVVIWLSITGSLYLFRPQIEAWIDRDYAAVHRTGQPAPMEKVVAAATAAIPNSKLAGIVLPEHANEAARILVSNADGRTRVYVHPDTLQILKTVPEEGRFERVLAHLHGELLIGQTGSVIVELAASWAIVMVATGLYLWWPRGAKGLGGVLYPRPGRRFLRDLHAVTGVWVSTFALFLLFTGLPWAFVWGSSLKQVRTWTHTAAISQANTGQDWTTSSAGEHAEHMHADMAARGMAMTDAPLDRIVARAEEQNLAAPVILTPPSKGQSTWWAKSNAQNRPARQDVAINAMTADIVRKNEFGQKHIIDQIVGFGTAAHEGQLFAPLNQILGVLVALGLVTLCVTAFLMWRKRAPDGVLGAPPPIPDARIGWGLAALILIAAVILPTLGACLIVIALVERLVLARLPAARRWLGLSPAR